MTSGRANTGYMRFTPTPDRGVEVVVELPRGSKERFHHIGQIDVDFAVARGGGPRPVWRLRLPRYPNKGDEILPSATVALMSAVTCAWKEHVDKSPGGRRDPVLDFLSKVIADHSVGSMGQYESAMAVAMREACLWRLRKAYDCCLHLVPTADMEAVRSDAIARSVIES